MAGLIAMRLLVVNAGSSTLKVAVVDADDRVELTADIDDWDGSDPTDAVAFAVHEVGPIDAVGHRIVHGGPDFTGPVVVTDAVVERIEALSTLAPLHQPRALAALAVARTLLPAADHVACFDTAFHATLPDAARTYALPAEWRQQWPLRRFGFHGISHEYVARRAPAVAGRPSGAGVRTVSCHLGAGASLCAIVDGRSIDTTMGFTPLEGLVMATRSGSVDPGLVLWLITAAGLDPDAVTEGLEHRGGLAGLSGTSGDLREVLAAQDEGSASAALAVDIYLHRLRRGIGAMAAVLGGIDVLAFTGGVGEHAPEVRAAATATLGFLGIEVDPARNRDCDGESVISPQGSATTTVVLPAREDLEIARQVRRTLG